MCSTCNDSEIDLNMKTDVLDKAPKLSHNGSAHDSAEATVDEDEEDMEAGPSRPPDDEDYGPDTPDDEDGRFFGGGITKDESEILDYMEGQDDGSVAPEKIDAAWVRKLALNFEKKISKNAELRAKYENNPQKFMESEADLDADVKSLSILSEHPELYSEFAKLGCVKSLVCLLAHENTDIAIDAIEIISELIDEDVEADPSQWTTIVDSMLEADILDHITSNFSRLDESIESDRAGVYHALSVLENLSSQPSIAEKVGKDKAVFKYLLSRIQKKEPSVTQNKQYAAEILAIMLQAAPVNRAVLAEQNGVDILLQLLAPYRKRDPAHGTEEEEFVENVFDALTCVVDSEIGKSKFVQAEGVELALIMIREGKMSRPRALRLLDHALSGIGGAPVCTQLIETAGLKVIFSMFMKKDYSETTEHLLGIFASLLRWLPANEAPRIRTLAKFVEKEYEKITKLVQLRRDYAARVEFVDAQIREEQKALNGEEREERADECLSRRLDAGLFCLQTIDVILAWMVAEDAGAEKKVRELLAERHEDLALLKGTIQGIFNQTLRDDTERETNVWIEQLDTIGDAESEEEKNTKGMLEALMPFLT